jgi:hypothetical protein
MAEKKNIYQRIAAVTSDIKAFDKDGSNTQFHFKYASIEQIVQTIQPVCIEHGITLIQEAETDGTIQKFEGGKGTNNISTCTVITHAINMDNPEDRVITRMPGQGYDSLDKGIFKAISGARKYAIFGMFNLHAGDDEPDADIGRGHEPPRQRTRSDIPPDDTFPPEPPVSGKGGLSDHPTDKQQKMIFARFKKMGYSDTQRKKVIQTLFQHTDSMKEITYDEGQALIVWIEKKEKELEARND